MKNGMTKRKAYYLARRINPYLAALPWWDLDGARFTIKDTAAAIIASPDCIAGTIQQLIDSFLPSRDDQKINDLIDLYGLINHPENIYLETL